MNENQKNRPCVCCGTVRPVDRPCPNVLCFLFGPNKTFEEMRNEDGQKPGEE